MSHWKMLFYNMKETASKMNAFVRHSGIKFHFNPIGKVPLILGHEGYLYIN